MNSTDSTRHQTARLRCMTRCGCWNGMGTRALQVRQHASGGGEKLQYDLFYIENASLDMLIMFQTIKIVLLGRGTQ